MIRHVRKASRRHGASKPKRAGTQSLSPYNALAQLGRANKSAGATATVQRMDRQSGSSDRAPRRSQGEGMIESPQIEALRIVGLSGPGAIGLMLGICGVAQGGDSPLKSKRPA